MKTVLSMFLIFFGALTSWSQSVQNFSLMDVASKSEVSLSDYAGEKGVAVIFTSNVCPYSIYYEGRITQLVADYADKGIQFLLINSHVEDKESIDEMTNKLSAWGLNVPYLADKNQVVLNQFGARKSPEVFLLKSVSGGFTIFYKGAIDNNPQVASDVKEPYLQMNIESLLKGGSSKSGGRPIGCTIRKG